MYFDQLLLAACKVHVVYFNQLLGAAHYIHFISNHNSISVLQFFNFLYKKQPQRFLYFFQFKQEKKKQCKTTKIKKLFNNKKMHPTMMAEWLEQQLCKDGNPARNYDIDCQQSPLDYFSLFFLFCLLLVSYLRLGQWKDDPVVG